VVTLGGIGSCYTSLVFYLIAFTASYKLCDNKSKPQPRDSPSQNRNLLAAATATTSLLQTCAQLANFSAHKCCFCSCENACQNEDWPPIFILNLADCLGRLLILGTNSLVYIISFSLLLLLEANNLIQVIPLS
jgi:hypothetical protein